MVNILERNYNISAQRSSKEMDECWGIFLSDLGRIDIAHDQPEDAKCATIIHEIIEGLNIFLDMELEHHQIDLLETGIYQVLKANGFPVKKILTLIDRP